MNHASETVSRRPFFPPVAVLACLFLSAGPALAADSRDLAGTWRFRIDRDDRGLAEQWWKRPAGGGRHRSGSPG